jgi:hypothetical protein
MGLSPDAWSPLLDDEAQEPLDYVALSYFDQLPPGFVEKLRENVESMEQLQRQKFQQSRAIRRLTKENLRLRRQCETAPRADFTHCEPRFGALVSSCGTMGTLEEVASQSTLQPTPSSPTLAAQGVEMSPPAPVAMERVQQPLATRDHQGAVDSARREPDSCTTTQHAAMEGQLRSCADTSACSRVVAAATDGSTYKSAEVVEVSASSGAPCSEQRIAKGQELEPDPLTILLKLRAHRYSTDRHRANLQELFIQASGFSNDMHRVQRELQDTRVTNENMLRKIEAALLEGGNLVPQSCQTKIAIHERGR